MTDTVEALTQRKMDALGESIRETRELIGQNILSEKLTTLFTRTNETHADMLALVGMVMSSRDSVTARSSADRNAPDADWYVTIRQFVRSLTEALHEIAGDGELDRESVHKVAHMADCIIESELEHGAPSRRYAKVLERDHWLRGRRQLVEELREAMAGDSYLADTGTPDVISRMAYALIESEPPPIVVPGLGTKPDMPHHPYHIVTIADTLRAPRELVRTFGSDARVTALAEVQAMAEQADRGHRYMLVCGPTHDASNSTMLWAGGRNFAGQYWERRAGGEDLRPLMSYVFCVVGTHVASLPFADHLREGGVCDPTNELVVEEFPAVASRSGVTLRMLGHQMNRPANDTLSRAEKGTPVTLAVLRCREILGRDDNADVLFPSEFDEASVTLIRATKGEQFISADEWNTVELDSTDVFMADSGSGE